MDFEPKTYLIIYAVIVTPILLSFLFMRRGTPPPTLLNMDGAPAPDAAKNQAEPLKNDPKNSRNVSPSQINSAPNKAPTPHPGAQSKAPPRTQEYAGGARLAEHEARVPAKKPKSKALNVLFQWNGHSWDAYEVLGVPAGSSMAAVEAAFKKASGGADADALPFFRAAYESILRS